MDVIQSIEITNKDDLLKQYEHVKVVGQGSLHIIIVQSYNILNTFLYSRFLWHCGFVQECAKWTPGCVETNRNE